MGVYDFKAYFAGSYNAADYTDDIADSFADGIEFMLRPFRRLGIPGHEIAMMMTIALRFIPTLMEESDKIRKAQIAPVQILKREIYSDVRNLVRCWCRFCQRISPRG